MPQINEALDVKDDVKTDANKINEGVVDATTVDKKEDKAEKKAEKKAKAKATKKEKDQTQRPPLEQITRDFEASIKNLDINGQKLVNLGYKCGKIIYGIKQETGKDFRVIAFKARKKSKSVNNKSRGIFYFGLDQKTATELVKSQKELKISKFGKCSVQSNSPVELILDRVTFTENFEKDADKVLALMNSAAAACVESKTELWNTKKAIDEEADK